MIEEYGWGGGLSGDGEWVVEVEGRAMVRDEWGRVL